MDNTASPPARARVLLVDDDHSVRASIRRVLARADLHVVEAGSGDAAAALIEQAAPFDMLLTDVRMPGSVDGVTLASYWREKVPGRPLLLVSGDSGARLDTGGLGPHEAVLHKPFGRACLLGAVLRLLAKVRHHTRSSTGSG